jgi:hypothetical protein
MNKGLTPHKVHSGLSPVVVTVNYSESVLNSLPSNLKLTAYFIHNVELTQIIAKE